MNRSSFSRRRLLAATGAVAAGTVAGCLGSGSSTGTLTVTEEELLPRPVRGDPEAAVTVATYEDFACPHCKDYNLERLPPIVDDYVKPGRVRYEHRDFPIPVDETHSWKAAIAARAVQAEASMAEFWPYVEALFENQDSLSLDTYESLADEAGVDASAVRTAAEEETYRPSVKADRVHGVENGIQGTPTVFVNGEVVTDDGGNVTSSTGAIRSAIESALATVTDGEATDTTTS